MLVRALLLSLLFCTCVRAQSTYAVGPGLEYATPQALYQAGVVSSHDTILISGDHTGRAALAVWRADSLIIRGVHGADGNRPHLAANGEYILGKGIWVCAGNGITVENIEFSGASVPDRNGAGIRLDGEGLTVRHCYFHDNENGILTNNTEEGDILIEFSEFAGNGFGDGLSHNLYVGRVNRLTFQFNISRGAKIGHQLKSRARENYVLYNRIMDEYSGNSSRLVDLSNGGYSVIVGNLFMQGPDAENNNMIGYGKEGLRAGATHELGFVHNSLVNRRIGTCLFVDIHDDTPLVTISNNIFAGGGTLTRGAVTTMTGNLDLPDISVAGFVDEPNFDYHLTSTSPAIDQGASIPSSLGPRHAYQEPARRGALPVDGTILDVGAYQFDMLEGVGETGLPTLLLYPNPARDRIRLDGISDNVREINVFSATGILVARTQDAKEVDVQGLAPGVYLVRVLLRDGRRGSRRVVVW